jgi:hypothetical protein
LSSLSYQVQTWGTVVLIELSSQKEDQEKLKQKHIGNKDLKNKEIFKEKWFNKIYRPCCSYSL